MTPRLLFMGLDLIDEGYISDFPVIEESKGFFRGKLAPSDQVFVVRNIDDQFSIDNPKSFLNKSGWLFSSIQYYDDSGVLRFDGLAVNITRNHDNATAIIKSKDTIYEKRKTPITYTSSDWETPATAAKNIMDAESFTDYDNASITSSAATLTTNGCYVKVNINQSDKITLFDAIEKLGVYGAADVYMHLNKIYYNHWTAFSGGISAYLDYDSTIETLIPLSAPSIETMEQDFFNDYAISYTGDGDTPATDNANNDIGATSRTYYGTQAIELIGQGGAAGKMIEFYNKASADYIGETYIRRSHYTLSPFPAVIQRCAIDVKYDLSTYIDLGTYYGLSFAGEGWTNKTWECGRIKKDYNKQVITLEGWEVA